MDIMSIVSGLLFASAIIGGVWWLMNSIMDASNNVKKESKIDWLNEDNFVHNYGKANVGNDDFWACMAYLHTDMYYNMHHGHGHNHHGHHR